MKQTICLLIILLFQSASYGFEAVDCTTAKYPDPRLTPGEYDINATIENLCTSGYTKSIRNVTKEEEREVFERYGMLNEFENNKSAYEVDHFISLELGGTNAIENLWPQPYVPKPGARQKDVVETNLHHRLCRGEITLDQAREKISHDWCAEYNQIKISRQH